MEQPTQAQIKEFWEKCDCLEIKQFPTTHPLLGSGDVVYVDTYVWKPTGQRLGHQMGACEFPPIDLNNLFKYAMPELERMITAVRDIPSEGQQAVLDLLFKWTRDVGLRREDPALALFWAIWEVITTSKEH